ncbi:MAG: hypothetical protein JWM59_315 [Verrucomicrobiales bacterium]|nr:hypothetical protein [Verrucomicrobiales bacterium]
MAHDLPSRIRKTRQELKLNQTEASVEWGVRLGTLASWENNRRRPSAAALLELNRILDSILGAPPQEPADESFSPRAPEPFAETGFCNAGESRRVNSPPLDIQKACRPLGISYGTGQADPRWAG